VNILKNICGDGFCDDPATLNAAEIQGITPQCICAPADEAQASEVIRRAIAHKLKIVPLGSATQQGSSAAPQHQFLALSTRGLNQLVAHEPGDMVATVQAGMELGAFQAKLAERGQWLPVNGDPRSTIGGLVSTDYSGPLAYGYGTLRDQVLGMRIVNGDGVARKCGGKVVKNVTGYPLEKLYIGSFGTLGLITEVTFKLRPFPVARNLWTIEVSTSAADALLLLTLIDTKNLPLEYVFASGPDALRVSVLASGTAKELDRIDAELKACANAFVRTNQETGWPAANGDGALAGTARSSVGATLRFWSLRSQVANAYEAVRQVSPAAPFSIGVDGGRIELAGLHAAGVQEISDALTKLSANFRYENMRGLIIDAPFGPVRGEWALMKRIHTSLDPHGLFNTGRFVV
jgi:FAD/FMN-containing dehydrogenase